MVDSNQYDVIIVGGGFSGFTAARELRMLGHKVIVLEARERIGGRTWVDKRLNSQLEMGGTYVHWHQPHIWTEITRYGLELTTGPSTEKVYWIVDGKTCCTPVSEFKDRFRNAIEKLLKMGNKYLPQPFQPLNSETFRKLDGKTADQFLKEFDLTKEEYDVIHGWVASDFCGAPEVGAATQILRWWAFSQGNWETHSAMVSTYRLKDGTSALIEAIAEDAEAEVKLSAIVKRIDHNKDAVEVFTGDGSYYKGKVVIVTVPLTTLQEIEFSPALSQEKQASSQEGQTSRGVKVWARVRGELTPFDALAPGNYPLNSVHLDRYIDGDSVVVGFGPSAEILDPNDRAAVEHALQHWLPDIEVLESTGHDWVNDEFSRETWPMLKPNQLTTYHQEWNTPENTVFLGGTTYANGWAGFIDGAIENGLTVSRRVHKYLTNDATLLNKLPIIAKNNLM